MPSMEMSPMDQREAFLAEQRRGLYTMQELCDRYAISRMMGFMWVARVAEERRAGLRERSRAPHSCPDKTSERVAELIIAARRAPPARPPTPRPPHEYRPPTPRDDAGTDHAGTFGMRGSRIGASDWSPPASTTPR